MVSCRKTRVVPPRQFLHHLSGLRTRMSLDNLLCLFAIEGDMQAIPCIDVTELNIQILFRPHVRLSHPQLKP